MCVAGKKGRCGCKNAHGRSGIHRGVLTREELKNQGRTGTDGGLGSEGDGMSARCTQASMASSPRDGEALVSAK